MWQRLSLGALHVPVGPRSSSCVTLGSCRRGSEVTRFICCFNGLRIPAVSSVTARYWVSVITHSLIVKWALMKSWQSRWTAPLLEEWEPTAGSQKHANSEQMARLKMGPFMMWLRPQGSRLHHFGDVTIKDRGQTSLSCWLDPDEDKHYCWMFLWLCHFQRALPVDSDRPWLWWIQSLGRRRCAPPQQAATGSETGPSGSRV